MRSKSTPTLTRIFNAVYNQSHKWQRSIARLWIKWCSLYKRQGVSLLPGVSVVLRIGRRWISRMTTIRMITIIIVMPSRWVTTIFMATTTIITQTIQPTTIIQQPTITWTHWIITWQNLRIYKDHNVTCLQYRSNSLSLATRAVSPKRDKKNLSMVTTIYTITTIILILTMVTVTITMTTVE